MARVMISFIVILLLHFSCALQAMPPRDALSPLCQKIHDNKYKEIEELLAAGHSSDQANDRTSGVTPLYVAQEYVVSEVRRLSVLRRLLRVGAWVDGRTADGSTTLMLAAYQGDTDAVSLLLEWGADPRLRNDAGEDAVSAAMESQHTEIADRLRTAATAMTDMEAAAQQG